MRELRQWRELDERRDPNILQALAEGHTEGQVAVATDLSVRHIQRIVQNDKMSRTS